MVQLKISRISPLVKHICRNKWHWNVNRIELQQKIIGNQCLSTSTSAIQSSFQIVDSDFIVRSPYPVFEPVRGLTIPEFIWQDLHVKDNAPALECAETGRKLTHGDVYRQSRGFAAALMQAGLKSRDVVSIVLPNMPEYAPVFFGIWEFGGVASPVNPSYTEEELIRQVKMSEAKAVVTCPQFLQAARAAKKSCPSLKSIIVTGEAHEGCHTFSEMVKVNSSGVDFVKGSQIDTTNEVAILPFSSGTTGPPKGVMLTHYNLCCNLKQYTSPDVGVIRRLVDGEQERLMGVLPFYHSYGMVGLVLTNNYLGTHLLCIPKFKPATFVQYIKYFKPTTLTLVTPIISFLASTPDLTAKDFASVNCVQAGAAPVGVVLINKFLTKAGKFVFFQEAFGLTELSPVSNVINPSRGNSKLGSCGALVPGTLGRVVDCITRKNLGLRENGEIVIKGPQVMKGYYKNEEATKNCIDSEGWFYTGDVGYYDEDGYFYIVDRLKELIKVKGLQVAPAELEDLLRKVPDVVDVAVIGIPDEKCGELPRAYIVRKHEDLTEAQIQEFVNGKVAKHKELKGGIEFVSIIPKAPSGKILRRELKADYLSKCGGK